MQALEQEERTNNPAPFAYALDHGGDPNATEQDSDTRPGTVRGWIKCLLAPERSGPSVLEVAVCDHQLVAVQLLLAHGADVRRRGLNGQTSIMDLAQYGMDCVDSWKSVASGPVPREMQDQDRADDEILSLLLAHGANINATTADGKTALMFAASQHSVACVRLLLDNGAKADKAADNGETALSDALGIVPDNPVFCLGAAGPTQTLRPSQNSCCNTVLTPIRNSPTALRSWAGPESSVKRPSSCKCFKPGRT